MTLAVAASLGTEEIDDTPRATDCAAPSSPHSTPRSITARAHTIQADSYPVGAPRTADHHCPPDRSDGSARALPAAANDSQRHPAQKATTERLGHNAQARALERRGWRRRPRPNGCRPSST